jgi:transcriptional regulator with XRE-family HTH domain
VASVGVDELLEQVRSLRTFPPGPERRALRDAAGLSLRAVAAALGCSHGAVAKWERGSTPREPTRKEYARLLAALRREV